CVPTTTRAPTTCASRCSAPACGSPRPSSGGRWHPPSGSADGRPEGVVGTPLGLGLAAAGVDLEGRDAPNLPGTSRARRHRLGVVGGDGEVLPDLVGRAVGGVGPVDLDGV